jgi:hypothetical protein
LREAQIEGVFIGAPNFQSGTSLVRSGISPVLDGHLRDANEHSRSAGSATEKEKGNVTFPVGLPFCELAVKNWQSTLKSHSLTGIVCDDQMSTLRRFGDREAQTLVRFASSEFIKEGGVNNGHFHRPKKKDGDRTNR